jgi:hypothetical protein
VAIKGEGTIDGNGDAFQFIDKRKTFRPEKFKKYTRQGMSYAGDSTEVSDGPAEPHDQRPYQMIISRCWAIVKTSHLDICAEKRRISRIMGIIGSSIRFAFSWVV